MKTSFIFTFLVLFLSAVFSETSFAHNGTATVYSELAEQLQELSDNLQRNSEALATSEYITVQERKIVLRKDIYNLQAKLKRERMQNRLRLDEVRKLKQQPAALLGTLSTIFSGCDSLYNPHTGLVASQSDTPLASDNLFHSSTRRRCYSVDTLRAKSCRTAFGSSDSISIIDLPDGRAHSYILSSFHSVSAVFDGTVDSSALYYSDDSQNFNYEVDFTTTGLIPQITLYVNPSDQYFTGSLVVLNGLKIRAPDIGKEYEINEYVIPYYVYEGIIRDEEIAFVGSQLPNYPDHNALITIMHFVNFLHNRIPALINGQFSLNDLPVCTR